MKSTQFLEISLIASNKYNILLLACLNVCPAPRAARALWLPDAR